MSSKHHGRKKSKTSNRDVRFTLSNNENKRRVSQANALLMRVKEQINEQFELPDFGSGLYGGDDNMCVFYDTNTIVASTVADRFINKFEQPDASRANELWHQCASDWITFEQTHIERYQWDCLGVSARSIVYKSRALIDSWLFDKKKEVNFFSSLDNAPIDFGPGESFDSTRGDVSSFSKLKNMRNWTCTIEAAPMASYFIAANKGLRALVVEYLRKKDIQHKIKARKEGRKYRVINTTRYNGKMKNIHYLAARVLSEFFYEYPMDHEKSRLRRGSHGTSVYKNRQKRRFINKECFLNIILQKVVGYSIRCCLKANAGIDLDNGQSYHRKMISTACTTLDESNASDSIVLGVLRSMISNKKAFSMITTFRSDWVLLDTWDHGQKGPKAYYPIKKVSSMGNGFTFELLTLVLTAISRQFDPNATVYGDDIICSNESANCIASAIQSVGFIPNYKKSFIAKPLRESCGAFYLDGFGRITCYDIKWCHDLKDVIAQCNKIGRIVNWNLNWNHKLRDVLSTLHSDLKSLIPAIYRGPVSSFIDLPEWLEDEKYCRAHRNNKHCKALYSEHSKLVDELANLYHWNDTEEVRYRSNCSVIHIREKCKKVKLRKQETVRSLALLYSYVRVGMSTDMECRVGNDEARYRDVKCIITPNGTLVRVGTARRITKLPHEAAVVK